MSSPHDALGVAPPIARDLLRGLGEFTVERGIHLEVVPTAGLPNIVKRKLSNRKHKPAFTRLKSTEATSIRLIWSLSNRRDFASPQRDHIAQFNTRAKRARYSLCLGTDRFSPVYHCIDRKLYVYSLLLLICSRQGRDQLKTSFSRPRKPQDVCGNFRREVLGTCGLPPFSTQAPFSWLEDTALPPSRLDYYLYTSPGHERWNTGRRPHR